MNVTPSYDQKRHTQARSHQPCDEPQIPADIDSPPFYLPLRSLDARFKLVSDLGSGSFGNVWLGKSVKSLYDLESFKSYTHTLMEREDDYNEENIFNKRTGLVAVKTMSKRLPLLNDYTRVKEIRFILAIPYHKNLVQVYDIFIDNENFRLHIAMECMDQNLYQLMKLRRGHRFSESTLKSILSQILNGVRHIHRNEYFHRDIKPENILISPANRYYSHEYIQSSPSGDRNAFIVKLADFGLARHISNKRPYTSYVSTRWYRAPEILLRNRFYSRPIDVWAFGCVAEEVASFRPLFPGTDEMDQTWKVIQFLGTPVPDNTQQDYHASYGYWPDAERLMRELGVVVPHYPCTDITAVLPAPSLGPLCDVIRACLSWNPDDRATVDVICQMPYFQETCVDDYDVDAFEFMTEPVTPLLPPSKPVAAQFNYEVSEKLAGIGSSSVKPGKIQSNIFDSRDLPLCSSILQEESGPFSFAKNNMSYSPSTETAGKLPPSTEVNSDINVPDLVHESRESNNENFLITPQGELLSNVFQKSLVIKTATPTIDTSFNKQSKFFSNGATNFGVSNQLALIDMNNIYRQTHLSSNYQSSANNTFLTHSNPFVPFASNGSNFNYPSHIHTDEIEEIMLRHSPGKDYTFDSNFGGLADALNKNDSDTGELFAQLEGMPANSLAITHRGSRTEDGCGTKVALNNSGFVESLYSNFDLKG